MRGLGLGSQKLGVEWKTTNALKTPENARHNRLNQQPVKASQEFVYGPRAMKSNPTHQNPSLLSSVQVGFLLLLLMQRTRHAGEHNLDTLIGSLWSLKNSQTIGPHR